MSKQKNISSAPLPTPDLDGLLDEMVNRFLSWKLPEDFMPDAGISFKKPQNPAPHWWPVGTNLFTATQAKAMMRYLTDGLIEAYIKANYIEKPIGRVYSPQAIIKPTKDTSLDAVLAKLDNVISEGEGVSFDYYGKEYGYTLAQAKAEILATHIPIEKVRVAIGEDENYIALPRNRSLQIKKIKDRNELRAELRKQLGVEDD